MDRNQKSVIIWRAENLELKSKAKGRQMGDVGQSGLAILRLLLFRYGDRPCPSYSALARHSKFCLQTIADALRRLRDAGIITIERRCVRTRLGARRITNQYAFAESLSLVHRPQRLPVERTFKERAFLPWNEWDSPVKDALDRLGQRMIERSMAIEGMPPG